MSDPRAAGTPPASRLPPRGILLNVSANLAGQAVAALVSVLCVPIYLRLLGAEAVGLLGFSLGLQAVIRVLDMGLSSAVVRQMARLGGQPGRRQELAEFYATFERLFAGTALAIALVTLAVSPLVVTHWLQGRALPPGHLAVAVAAISVQSALFFAGTLYHGTLMGLERQPLFNAIRVAEVLVSQLGAVLLLSVLRPTVPLLFGWQLAVALVALAVYARATRSALPAGTARGFRFEHVRSVWTFAAGMAGITATGTVLANMDKVFLSRWLQLGAFGHYTLAFYAASLVAGLLVAPVFNALFPRHCALVEQGDDAAQRALYHLSLQALVTLVWPIAAVLWVFARPVLQLWVQDPAAVAAAERVLPLLVLGVALNTLMVPAYMVQLSHAWTRLGVALNLVLIAVFVPLLYLLTIRQGLAGAALNFALMQGAYLLVGLPLTHRRLLREALGEAVVRDIVPGIALCAFAGVLFGVTRGAVEQASPALRYAAIFGAWAALTAGTALVSSRVRPVAWRMLTGRWNGLGALVA